MKQDRSNIDLLAKAMAGPDKVIWTQVRILARTCLCLKNSGNQAHLDNCLLSLTCQCEECQKNG